MHHPFFLARAYLCAMKITVGQLRAIIRECLEEGADAPGRWRASSGEPVDPDEVDLMTTAGLGRRRDEAELEEDLQEALFGPGEKAKFVGSSPEEMSRKYPEFFAYAKAKLGRGFANASFAIDKSGLLSRGVPYVAPEDTNLPVIFWNAAEKKFDFNSSVSLAREIRAAAK